MARSRNRDIATILGRTESANTTNARIQQLGEAVDSGQVENVAIQKFTALDSLPSTDLQSGQRAWIESSGRLYISNGSGWYNIALVNISPTFDSDLNATFTIVDSATSLIITNPASDSDAPDALITYSGTASDSGQYLVTITNDSSVWTFDPLSADSVYSNVTAGNIPDSNGGDFTYTFKASDGISFATKTVTITYDGIKPADRETGHQVTGYRDGYTSPSFNGVEVTFSNSTEAENFKKFVHNFSIGAFSTGGITFGTSEGNLAEIKPFYYHDTDARQLTATRSGSTVQITIPAAYQNGVNRGTFMMWNGSSDPASTPFNLTSISAATSSNTYLIGDTVPASDALPGTGVFSPTNTAYVP